MSAPRSGTAQLHEDQYDPRLPRSGSGSRDPGHPGWLHRVRQLDLISHKGDLPAGIVEYRLPGDWRVLAGRNGPANDYLSLKLAEPNDLWLHLAGAPGSHVLLRVPAGRTPDRETRELAAAIAAYHSKARTAGTVAVSCTEARHVSKPAGAAPGTVTLRKQSVLKVRPLSENAIAALRLSST